MTSQPVSAIHPLGHAHAADIDACVEFVNSESFDDGVPVEGFPTVDGAVAWFATHGLAHEDALRAHAAAGPSAWLARVHASRAALREVWDAEVEHRVPSEAAVDAVNQILRKTPSVELVPSGDSLGVGHRHRDDDVTGEVLARIVQPLVTAIAAGDTARFRICANEGCRWIFEDTSRAGRRRWCDMSTCGNRAKVRRYRSRRHALEPGGPA